MTSLRIGPALFPLLTLGLLAACGPVSLPGSGATTFSVAGDVVLPAAVATASTPWSGSNTAAPVPGDSTAGVSAQRTVTDPAARLASELPAPESTAPDWTAPHVRGRVLLLAPAGGGASSGALGGRALAGPVVARVADTEVQALPTPVGRSDEAYARELQAQGYSVQPDYLYAALSEPNDPGYPANSGVAVGGTLYDQDYLTRINALDGWNALEAAGRTPVGVLVAVLDTGAEVSHPDLAGRLLPGRDFCSALNSANACTGTDNDPSEVHFGDVGHGTSSAGLIGAATNNRLGIAGLTWSGRNILPVKVFGDNGSSSSATTSSVAAGLDYAVAQKARVINLSLGFVGSNDAVLTKSLQAAEAADVVVVAAAGNTPDEGVYAPANAQNVLAVGAVGSTNDLACYSARPKNSTDRQLDLVAPGGNAGSGTGQCYSSNGQDILTLTTAAQGRYTLRAGTSEAAPQVSGAAALMRAYRSDLSAAQIRSLLKSSAKVVAGGRLLDVGAAIRAAGAAPTAVSRSYAGTVQALRANGEVLKSNLSGTLPAGSTRVPYSLGGLTAGTYTLTASLTLNGKTYAGSRSLTVSSDQTAVDISAQ